MRSTRFLRFLIAANLGFIAIILATGVLLYQFANLLPRAEDFLEEQNEFSPANVLGLQTFSPPLYFAQIEDSQINILQGNQTGALTDYFSFSLDTQDIPAGGMLGIDERGEVIYISKNLEEFVIYSYSSNASRTELLRTADKVRGISTYKNGKVLVLTSKNIPNTGAYDYTILEIQPGNLPKKVAQFQNEANLYIYSSDADQIFIQSADSSSCVNFFKPNSQLSQTTCAQQALDLVVSKYIAVRQLVSSTEEENPESMPVSGPISETPEDYQYFVYEQSEWLAWQNAINNGVVDPIAPKSVYQSELDEEIKVLYNSSGALYLLSETEKDRERTLVMVDLLQSNSVSREYLPFTNDYRFLGKSGIADSIFLNLIERSNNASVSNLLAYEINNKRLLTYSLPSCNIASYKCEYLLLN